jgi:hypothetical protein
VMRTDGSDVTALTSGPADEDAPQWSPDGAWIVFTSHTGGSQDLYRVRRDGSDRQPLTQTPGHEKSPVWSPRQPVDAARWPVAVVGLACLGIGLTQIHAIMGITTKLSHFSSQPK